MLHTNNPIIKHKVGLLNLAEELSNVFKACKIMGVSRETFYRYQELADNGGIDALVNQSKRVPNLKIEWMKQLNKRSLFMQCNTLHMVSIEPVMS